MANLNKCLIIGNLTRDPELRYTAKGTAIADISLAVNRVTKGEDGQKREECTFVDITLWSRLAEVAGQYLKKGSPVFIEVVSNWTPGTTSRPVRNGPVCAWSPKIFNCSAVDRKVKAPPPVPRIAETLRCLRLLPGPNREIRIWMPNRTTFHFDL